MATLFAPNDSMFETRSDFELLIAYLLARQPLRIRLVTQDSPRAIIIGYFG
jgi:hypothetical protein